MYRWGYFPETRFYDKTQWESLKPREGRLEIVWAGRFIPLKHPEYMVRLARRLADNAALWQKNGVEGFHDFHIHMAGSGEMEEELRAMAKAEGVADSITFHGFMTPEKVRHIMEGCHIHVFTSNHLEGWGAVVNEAMNSGCAEVAKVQAGAVPYLLRHGENGFVYPDGDFEKMAELVQKLAAKPSLIQETGKAAYETITKLWNAERAAGELVRFAKGILEGKPEPAKEGPLSPAPVIAPGRMYRLMMKK